MFNSIFLKENPLKIPESSKPTLRLNLKKNFFLLILFSF